MQTENPARAAARAQLAAYQLEELNATIRWACEHAPFFRQRFAGSGIPQLSCLKDLERLPFTTEADLRNEGARMLCVSSSQVWRIVTLPTSGTTGQPKRIAFTGGDLELTVDYFRKGMRHIAGDRDLVLIMMPCRRPASVGDLLQMGLARDQVISIPFGTLEEVLPSERPARLQLCLERIRNAEISCIVGLPEEVAAVASLDLAQRAAVSLASPQTAGDPFAAGQEDAQQSTEQIASAAPPVSGAAGAAAAIHSVLLSGDYVSPKAVETIRRAWGCQIYEHYGMTEMGLGCAVSCGQGAGYHVREKELYLEIIDPETGCVVPDGQRGEIVFSTMNRRAMPFIRYRTGDFSRWLTEPCPCGRIEKRLDKVGPRAAE